MQIEIHGLNVVIHRIPKENVDELVDLLNIKRELFVSKNFSNTTELTYSFVKGTQSVYIRINNTYDKKYLIMNLKGSFFDNSPDFRLKKLLNFLSRFNYTIKQLDIAFNDDRKRLSIKKIKYWCKNSEDYCTGSLVLRNAPIIAMKNGKFVRIQLHTAASKTNYGTIYRRPDTRIIRLELKIKDKHKIEYILEKYSSKNIEVFQTRSLETLVSCINFITYQSKKNRIMSKYKKQPSWELFLGSDIKKIKWSEIHKKRRINRQESDNAIFHKRITRQATMVNNMVRKLKLMHSEENILKCFSDLSEYQLVKKGPES